MSEGCVDFLCTCIVGMVGVQATSPHQRLDCRTWKAER